MLGQEGPAEIGACHRGRSGVPPLDLEAARIEPDFARAEILAPGTLLMAKQLLRERGASARRGTDAICLEKVTPGLGSG